MGQVHRLAAVESALVDSESIRVLRQSLGEAKYDEVLDESLIQITRCLSLIESALRREDLPAIYRHCLVIVGSAEQIGLVGVAWVARDLMNCLRIGNSTAIHAVTARLIRMAEDSLFSPGGLTAR
jgi:hypothetical protein